MSMRRPAPMAPLVPGATLRRSMVLTAFGLVLVALAAFIAGLYVFVYVPLTHDLATAQLRVVSEQVEGRLATLVNRVEAIARLNHDWGRQGLFDVGDPVRFNRVYRPLIERGPQLSSVVLAHESGRELLLLQGPDGRWINRLTDPGRQGRRARFLTWAGDGQLLSDETRELDYDARQRPWFQGGMALRDERDIHWSAPYVFRSTQEPGLSVVVSWRTAQGERYAMTTDIRLIDLSRFTRDIVAGKTGFVAVFTGDGRVVGVPHDARFAQDEGIRGAVLQAVGEIGMPPLSAAIELWQRAGRREGELLRFELQGTAWLAAFKPTHFGSQVFWVATMAPEADFSATTSTQAAAIVLLVLGTLVLAWFAATRLAHRFARPLESLVDESQRIGRLELAAPVVVRAPWREIDALARAQESMRVELLGATSRLAEANQRLELRVRERTRQLAEAKERAEAATRAKADFLANMSHEIRTPMNAVIGMIELALLTDAVDRQRGYLHKAKVAAASLLVILNDILDFSKIEAGKLDLEARAFRLDEVLEKLTSLVGVRAQEKGLELVRDTAADVPPVLVGDSLRLEQVLVNLCSNAVKFTTAGKVVLVVTVKTPVDADGHVTLRFSVRDTGIGMTAQQVASLFQPFNQLDASTTRQYGGTGLGLAICKRLVDLMGGEIGASSQPGVGSDFHFSAVFGVAASAPAQPVAARAAPVNLQGRRVLLVEDNEFNQIVAEELLSTSAGMQVTLARNGQEALDRLPTQPFDAVLMDVQMPVMDGYQATAAIRRQAQHASLPIIAMTAHAMAGDRDKCLAAGMNDHVSKPFEPLALFAVLSNWMPGAGSVAPPAATAAGVDGVSFERGLQRCLDRQDLYLKILRRFVATRVGEPAQVRAALDAGQPEQAASLVHNIISTAGTIGADGLSEAARALQLAIDAGEAERWPGLLETFARQHAQVSAQLGDYLAEHPEAA